MLLVLFYWALVEWGPDRHYICVMQNDHNQLINDIDREIEFTVNNNFRTIELDMISNLVYKNYIGHKDDETDNSQDTRILGINKKDRAFIRSLCDGLSDSIEVLASKISTWQRELLPQQYDKDLSLNRFNSEILIQMIPVLLKKKR